MPDRPDWNAQVLIKGNFGSTLTPIAVDINGNLLALIQGDYGGILKNIAVDANGIMKANLAVQDLAYLKFRPVYGQRMKQTYGANVSSSGNWTTIFSVTGRGAAMGGWVGFQAGQNPNTQHYRMEVDGAVVEDNDALTLYTDNLIRDLHSPFSALYYDPTGKTFIMQIGSEITFEATLVIKAAQDSGSTLYLGAWLYYALVP